MIDLLRASEDSRYVCVCVRVWRCFVVVVTCCVVLLFRYEVCCAVAMRANEDLSCVNRWLCGCVVDYYFVPVFVVRRTLIRLRVRVCARAGASLRGSVLALLSTLCSVRDEPLPYNQVCSSCARNHGHVHTRVHAQTKHSSQHTHTQICTPTHNTRATVCNTSHPAG